MSSSSPPPHVLLVSVPLQGHVNPLLVLGRRLAATGLLVTFSTVPHAGLKFPYPDGASVGVGRGTLRFEHLRGGDLWPPHDARYGGNGTDVIRHLDEAGPAALAGLLARRPPEPAPVSCVVANAFHPWAGRVADGTGVPHAVLWTESCAVLSLLYHHFRGLAEFPPAEAGPGAPVAGVPGMPATMVAADLPGLIHVPEQFVWRRLLVEDLRSLGDTVSWVLVNTFGELERPAFDALRRHLPSVIPVGPLLVGTTAAEEEASHGGEDDDGCMAWLDAQPRGSVVLVAFGSMVKVSRDEMVELAAGLAATGRPFLLVVRDNNREDLDDCLAAAFSGGGGKLVAWCEQARVLSHGAVGCFVTHCGWNSTVEALASGVPVVTYPTWADQPTNAKFLDDVFRVGVRLPRPMARDALRRCVEEVMAGPEAAAMRARAERWKAEASAALAAGGSSERGIREFVDAALSSIAAGDD
ncbi:hypothetical protein U9M48_020692 [Paspalum notatum var. saurae]|uniref:Glycosyltransferase n=1 Tax=Paspalum notatum var. saurae TaxID=547442 RepID=A0AAQ3WRZ9_PASNO